VSVKVWINREDTLGEGKASVDGRAARRGNKAAAPLEKKAHGWSVDHDELKFT